MSEEFPDPPLGFTVGSLIAGYRLDELIGQGGMAVVFRARDERLDRQVALKILMPALAADQAFRQRFIRESRAAAAVDDPHIIPVFEAGEASGVLFIAMRFVPDGDLRSLVQRVGSLPPARMVEIVSQVASALDAAHRHGLVHRDVKPANMLLGVTEGRGRPDHVYLSDFGLSKGFLQATRITGTGMFLGTLDYVAPEQIQGQQVDGRTDQYSLACTAYELLSGEPPFAHRDAMGVMYAQMSVPPPQLTTRRPDLPAAADAVFGRALAKSPEGRYATCRDFAEALRDALVPALAGQGAGGAGRPDEAGTQSWTVPRPGPAAAGAAAPPTAVKAGPTATRPDLAKPAGETAGDTAGRRSRSGRIAAIAAGVIVLLAGAGVGAALTLHHRPGHSHRTGRARHAARLVSLSPPACGTATGTAPSVRVTPASTLTAPAPPGTLVTAGLGYTFVSLPSAIEVLRDRAGIPANPPVQVIPISDHPHGQAITSDGRYLVTGTTHGAVVIRVSAAEHPGTGPAVVGRLQVGQQPGYGGDDVMISPDNHFVFVAMRYANAIAVFNLARALQAGFGQPDLVGFAPVGVRPHGMALSADGRWLYVTNRFVRGNSGEGSISVLSLQAAETNPSGSVVRTAAVTGCGAYRVIASPDGTVLWVIAQSSNYLVGLSAARLRTDPAHAIIAKVAIGSVPLDETFVNGGSRILVTDAHGADVAVVDPAAALAGKPHALLGYIVTSPNPGFFDVEPAAGIVLLSSEGTVGQVEALRLADLP